MTLGPAQKTKRASGGDRRSTPLWCSSLSLPRPGRMWQWSGGRRADSGCAQARALQDFSATGMGSLEKVSPGVSSWCFFWGPLFLLPFASPLGYLSCLNFAPHLKA